MVSQQKKNIENYRQTVISYNRGASWHSVPAPDKKYNGDKMECGE